MTNIAIGHKAKSVGSYSTAIGIECMHRFILGIQKSIWIENLLLDETPEILKQYELENKKRVYWNLVLIKRDLEILLDYLDKLKWSTFPKYGGIWYPLEGYSSTKNILISKVGNPFQYDIISNIEYTLPVKE